MRDNAWRSYEEWRRLWLSAKDGHGIAMLRFHGLRGALELAGCVQVPPGPRLPASASVAAAEILIGDAALAEAARQVRRLMGLGAGAAGRHEARACPN